MARQIGKMLNAREPKVVNGPEILNKFVGQSEENIRKLFADAEKEVRCLAVLDGADAGSPFSKKKKATSRACISSSSMSLMLSARQEARPTAEQVLEIRW